LAKWITLPGFVDYQDGLEIMENQVDRVINCLDRDTIFLLEHNEVYTAGTSYNINELLNPYLFPIIYTGRGGKFTYHGPGQRVIYPIINLNNKNNIKDLKLYVTKLEKWIILTLAEFKIQSFTIPNNVGIWVKNNKNIHAKIGAIGIRVRKWVTYHGIAVNISANLEHYSGIIPCGINNFPITSLKDIGTNISIEEFDIALRKKFTEIF
jgi:lipoyl(octanoyl) transferase